MSAGRCCKCGPGRTKLWTTRRAWTESVVLPNRSQRVVWRCEGCRTPSSRFAGSLWFDTFVSAGGSPSCELGCIGTAPHLAGSGGCPRTPAKTGVQVVVRSIGDRPPAPIRLSLLSPDFVRVHNAHPTHICLVRLVVRDTGGVVPFPFPVEVCILPGPPLGAVIPCGHRTRLTHRGVTGAVGDLPWQFYVVRATVVDAVPVRDGAPSAPFLGVGAPVWAALRTSECAWRRYAPLFYGHTAALRVASGTARPAVPLVGTTVHPQRPHSVAGPGGGTRCGYCHRRWASDAEYARRCAPDMEAGHISGC